MSDTSQEETVDPIQEPEKKGIRYAAPALEKGLDILEALSESAEGYTLNELCQALGRNVNEIFRMAVTLQRRGYIQADQNDRYTLTLKMFRLAHRQQPIKSLVGAALPLLHELAERARQSCTCRSSRMGASLSSRKSTAPSAGLSG